MKRILLVGNGFDIQSNKNFKKEYDKSEKYLKYWCNKKINWFRNVRITKRINPGKKLLT